MIGNAIQTWLKAKPRRRRYIRQKGLNMKNYGKIGAGVYIERVFLATYMGDLSLTLMAPGAMQDISIQYHGFVEIYDKTGLFMTNQVTLDAAQEYLIDQGIIKDINEELFLMEIPNFIKCARTTAGLTQTQLGEKCGYDEENAQRYVSGWESGVRPVPTAKMKVVAEALGVEVEKLLP